MSDTKSVKAIRAELKKITEQHRKAELHGDYREAAHLEQSIDDLLDALLDAQQHAEVNQ